MTRPVEPHFVETSLWQVETQAKPVRFPDSLQRVCVTLDDRRLRMLNTVLSCRQQPEKRSREHNQKDRSLP